MERKRYMGTQDSFLSPNNSVLCPECNKRVCKLEYFGSLRENNDDCVSR